MMRTYLGKKGMLLDGIFIIRMVDTWTPVFDLSDKEKNRMITDAAEGQIAEVTEKAEERIAGNFNHKKLPGISAAYWNFQYKHGRKTIKFRVEDTCIGCGLCAKICPVGAIEMRDNKPSWIREQCTLCLGCLHRCPQFAIQYGRHTKKHGQFVNPNVKL